MVKWRAAGGLTKQAELEDLDLYVLMSERGYEWAFGREGSDKFVPMIDRGRCDALHAAKAACEAAARKHLLDEELSKGWVWEKEVFRLSPKLERGTLVVSPHGDPHWWRWGQSDDGVEYDDLLTALRAARAAYEARRDDERTAESKEAALAAIVAAARDKGATEIVAVCPRCCAKNYQGVDFPGAKAYMQCGACPYNRLTKWEIVPPRDFADDPPNRFEVQGLEAWLPEKADVVWMVRDGKVASGIKNIGPDPDPLRTKVMSMPGGLESAKRACEKALHEHRKGQGSRGESPDLCFKWEGVAHRAIGDRKWKARCGPLRLEAYERGHWTVRDYSRKVGRTVASGMAQTSLGARGQARSAAAEYLSTGLSKMCPVDSEALHAAPDPDPLRTKVMSIPGVVSVSDPMRDCVSGKQRYALLKPGLRYVDFFDALDVHAAFVGLHVHFVEQPADPRDEPLRCPWVGDEVCDDA